MTDYQDLRAHFLKEHGATEDDVFVENGIEYVEAKEIEGQFDDVRIRTVHVPVPAFDKDTIIMRSEFIHEAEKPHRGGLLGKLAEQLEDFKRPFSL